MQDFYLRFNDEVQATLVLYTTTVTAETLDEEGNIVTEASVEVKPNYQNIDTIGVIYESAPEPLPDPYTPVPYDGWFVNVRLVGEEDAAALQPFNIDPKPYPMRVWAT